MTALHPGDRPAARPAPATPPQVPADAPHRPLRRGLDIQRGALVTLTGATEAGR